MSNGVNQQFSLESLAQGIPAIPSETVDFYKQNCMICLDNQGHRSGVSLSVSYNGFNRDFDVCWTGVVEGQLLRAYADLVRATEYGAITLALLLVREITGYTAVEQAVRGTSVDYYLASKDEDESLFLNHAARLEVTGILQEGGPNTIEARLKGKVERLKPGIPAFIAIVEFSNPKSALVKV